FHVSRGKELKMRDIAMACMEAAGREVPIEQRPYRPGEEGQRECFSIENARTILGYEPKVDLAEGLPKTAEWIKKEEGLE
ncbi:hypothetical protein KY335_03525, partial [Candidatus Woesearchaeota archaeon]|nr:hypothetical protein [Candidatus Woesearchaeota archaeon]